MENKSAKLSERELRTSTTLVHPWEQGPDVPHASVPIYGSITRMFCCHTAQEGDGFYVPKNKNKTVTFNYVAIITRDA